MGSHTTIKIGLINGSVREASNTAGLVEYIQTLVPAGVELDCIHLTKSPGHPLPYVIEDTIPAAQAPQSLPNAYAHPDVRLWSNTVKSWSGVIICTPQYNWGYPGILKNALDHLFLEWRDMPAGIITIGGHGGGKCAAQLRQVLEGGCKMRPIEKDVAVPLPKDTIAGPRRLTSGDAVYEAKRDEILAVLQDLLSASEARGKQQQ